VRVVGEDVRKADQGGVAVDFVGMVALDRVRDRLRQTPAAGQHAAHDGMVDAELTPLARDALLRCARVAVNRVGVAGIRVHQDELPDVVQQRCDDQPVAVRIADLAGQQISGRAGGKGVQAKAVGHRVPHRAAFEEVKCSHPLGELLDGLGAQDPHGVDDVLDLPAAAGWQVVGDAHDRNHERDIGLDCLDDLGDRHPVTADERQQPVARFSERRESLERFERCGQPAAVTLAGAELLEPGDTGHRNCSGHGLICWHARFRIRPCG